MPITFRCPSCQHEMTVADAHAGQRGACPRCRQLVVAPAPSLAASTPSLPPGALGVEIERARSDPRRRFGRYVLLSELGRGGMGAVHRAWDERLSRVVALKVVLENADPDAVARFRREAEAVARLKHPGIVGVFDSGEVEGRHYLVLELIEGRSLKRLLHPGEGEARIPLTRALEVVRDVAHAIHYAHEQGVVHRDLKPENVLVDPDGGAHVLDFGLASLRGAPGEHLTRTGTTLGTPAYMPPEQAGGEGPIDARSDVWSLGATLYHVLAGRPPFEGPTELNVLAAVLGKDPVPPATLNPRAAGDLETICLRCLEKAPERRYPSAEAFAQDLDRHLAGEPIEARPIGSSERAWRRVKRNKAGTAVAVLLALLVASLGLGAASARRERARVEQERARAQLEADRGEARRAVQAFEEARKKDPHGASVFALGIDALAATARLAAIEREDAASDARRRAFDTATALGDAAAAREQWDLAGVGYRRAADLHVDDAAAAARLRDLEERRTRAARERRAAVEGILNLVREGRAGELGGTEAAVLELVRYPDAQTVELVVQALGEATAALTRARRKVLLESGVPGVEAAVDALDRSGFEVPLPADVQRVLEAAARARAEREARERTASHVSGTDAMVRSFAGILADEGTLALGDPGKALATVACETLGWIRLEPAAFEPLARYLELEAEPRRAATAAIALLRLGSPRAKKVVEQATARFGRDSIFFDRVQAERLDRSSPAPAPAPRSGVPGDLDELTRAVERDPTSPAPYVNRAAARQAKGDLDGAFADITRALELGPARAGTLNGRGVIRALRGDLDGAIADFERAIELDPRHAEAHRNLGLARTEKGDLDGAIAELSRAIELDPRDSQAFYMRGADRKTRGDLAGALADDTKAVELDPKNARAFHNRANVRGATGDAAGALADYAASLELQRAASTLVDRSSLRLATGDVTGALADANEAIELAPGEAGGFLSRGLARQAQGDLPGAIEDASKAAEVDPRSGRALHNRGNARLAARDVDGAIADYGRAFELDPTMAASIAARGAARYAKGDVDGAIADLTRATEVDSHYAKAYANRGLLYTVKGEVARARADLARFLELAPRSPDAPAIRAKLEELGAAR